MSRIVLLTILLVAAPVLAQAPRFVIDDDDYVARVTEASAALRRQHQLLKVETLRREVRNHTHSAKLAPLSRRKMEPPDLYEHLRESTLAVGTYYHCSDCGEWHFNSSAGFVVAEGGVICTCCHVVLGDDDSKESYLIAADANGKVYPVRSVLAADTDSDTCFVKIDAPGLAPLPLRPGARTGERVYCLSHPGGYHFMFTQGMIARVNRRRNDVLDERGNANTNGLLTRPILLLNVTAEFAPGSSGAPIVDESGNVVAQVASIADAGDPGAPDDNTTTASPSVPIRFCTAAEEILRLTGTLEMRSSRNAAESETSATSRTNKRPAVVK